MEMEKKQTQGMFAINISGLVSQPKRRLRRLPESSGGYHGGWFLLEENFAKEETEKQIHLYMRKIIVSGDKY
ncbi:hypothetical protein DERP_010235 [Dermatophagoides pteronyssinus]|uniref:Uncharacterized protein n=1 Tax=Dermatophagoides pteronyssinus TaxID=6956 RepID=A0ABQ8J728_DERPT|nr:hypothetical protein DERP_010235 [Dermatophagoides pteronyssinus]